MSNPFATPDAPLEGTTPEEPGMVKRVARDVAMGTVMAPVEAARGALTGLQETAQTVTSIVDALPGGSQPDPENLAGRSTAARYLNRPLDAVSDGLGAVRDMLPSSETVTGGLVAGVGQFLAGNLMAGRVLRMFGLANKGGAVVQAVTRDALGSAIAFDPREERLSNLLRDHAGLRDPITGFLAADEDDSEALGRFKSAIENGGLGAVGEALFHAVRGLKASRAGNIEEAVQAAEAAEKAVGPEEAQRLVSEELRVKMTQERWLKATVKEAEDTRTTEVTTTRSTDTTTTEKVTAERPDGGNAADPEMTVAKVGGEARPDPVSISDEEGLAILKALDEKGEIDRDTALPVWRNLDRMSSSDDAVRLLRQLQTHFEGRFKAARGEAVDLEQQKKLAEGYARAAVDSIAVDSRQGDLILQSLAAGQQDVRKAAAAAEAARAMSSILQKRLTERADEVIAAVLHGKGAETVDKDKLLADFLRDASFLNNVDALQGGYGTAFSQALGLRRIIYDGADGEKLVGDLTRVDAPGSTVTEKVTTRNRKTSSSTSTTTTTTRTTIEESVEGGERFVLEMAYRLKYAKNTKQARQIVAKSLEGPGAWDAAGEYWMGSLLSSVKTFTVGAVTSTARTFVQNPAEKAIAGILQGTLGRVTNGALTGGTDFHLLREAGYQYRGYMNAFREAASLSWRAVKNGDSIFDPSLTQVEKRTGAFAAQTFGAGDDSMHGFLINSLGKLSRAPSALLVGQDEFFKVLHYRGALYAQARREGVDMGFSGINLKQHIQARLDATLDAAGRPTDDAALAAARNITFTDEFGEGFISRMGEAVQAAKARNGALQVLLPFVRVPTNVLREGMTYNPVTALMQKEFRQELAAGGDRAGMAWARLGTATALSMVLFDLASEGLITGNGPTNPQARAAWQQYGWQPNSVLIPQGDGTVKAVSYARFDPYSTLFSVIASVRELADELDQDTRDSTLNDAIMLTVMGTAKALASRTYATGLMQFADMLSGGGGTGEAALNSLAATLIPAAARDLSTLGYDNQAMRQAHTMLDAMKARTAGFGDVDPRYNALGKIVTLPAGWWGGADAVVPEALVQVISPAAVRTKSNDPLASELLRLQMTHYAAFAPPSKNPGGVGVDLTDFRHPNGGTAYGRLQALVGEVKIGGRDIEQRLREFVTSARYDRLTDGTADINGTKLQAVQAIFADYQAVALRTLQKEMPEVGKAIRERELMKARVQREGAEQAFLRAGREYRSGSLTLQALFQDD